MSGVEKVFSPWKLHKPPVIRLHSSRGVCIYIYMCVCVCPTLDKGFSTTTLSILQEQGAEGSPVVASANEAPHWTIRKTYLRRDTTPLFLAVV